MSLTIRCDFCGVELPQDYKRPGVQIWDQGFVAAEYDVCSEDAALIVVWLQQRLASREGKA